MKAYIVHLFTCIVFILISHGTYAQEYPFVKDSVLNELEIVMKQDADSSLDLISYRLDQAREAAWLDAEVNLRILYLDALHYLNEFEVFFDSVRAHKKLYQVWKDEKSPEEQELVEYLLGATLMEIGKTYLRQGKNDSCILVSREAKEILTQLPESDRLRGNLATINNSIAGGHFRAGRQDEAEKLYEENLIIFEELGLAYNVAATNINLGTMAANRGILSKALKHNLRALDLSLTHDLSLKSMATMAVSQTYHDLKETDKALKFSLEALELANEQDDVFQLSMALPELAANYRDLGQLDSALYYFEEYLALSLDLGYTFDISNAYESIGRVLMLQGKYETGLDRIRQGLEIANSPNDNLVILYLLNAEATCLHNMGRSREALQSITKLVELANQMQSNLNRRNSYAIAQRVYKANNMYKEAFEALEYYVIYNDSTYSNERSIESARVEYDYQLKIETERLELEQEKQDALYEQELKRERLIQYGAFGTTGFIAVIFIILYQSFQQKKKNNKNLRHRNEIIELKNNELTEKNREISNLRDKEKQMADDALAMKERELTTITMLSHEKNAMLQNLGDHIGSLTRKVDDRIIPDLEEIKKIIKANLSEETWSSFMMQFEKVHPKFFSDLKTKFPSLTQHDLRLCSYLKVGMDNKEIAQISAISLDSVKKNVYRLKKKMELDPEQDLREFFMS